MIVERNNHGISVCDRLKQLDYKSLYIEESLDRRFDGRRTPRVGFLTTAKTKPLIVDNLAALLRLEKSGIVDLINSKNTTVLKLKIIEEYKII